MSVTPAFELGVWNAWILVIYVIFYNMSPYLLSSSGVIDKKVVDKVSHHDMELDTKLTKSQKKLGNLITFVFFFPIAYSIFLPLKLNTFWLYSGFIVYFIGVSIGTIAMYDFLTAPMDKPVTIRAYRISRNPMYLSIFLIFIGTGIACLSWVFFLFTLAFVILTHMHVISEEHFCLQKYGDIYREYIARTPRWIGIPKAGKR